MIIISWAFAINTHWILTVLSDLNSFGMLLIGTFLVQYYRNKPYLSMACLSIVSNSSPHSF